MLVLYNLQNWYVYMILCYLINHASNNRLMFIFMTIPTIALVKDYALWCSESLCCSNNTATERHFLLVLLYTIREAARKLLLSLLRSLHADYLLDGHSTI